VATQEATTNERFRTDVLSTTATASFRRVGARKRSCDHLAECLLGPALTNRHGTIGIVALSGTRRVCLFNISVGTTGGGHCT
jgi:hypothetical protein